MRDPIVLAEQQLKTARRRLRRLARRHPDGHPNHLAQIRRVHALNDLCCDLYASNRKALYDRLMGDDQ